MSGGGRYIQCGDTGQRSDSCPRWVCMRFHHTTENSVPFETYALLISAIVPVIFSDHGYLKPGEVKLWMRDGDCTWKRCQPDHCCLWF